MKFHVDKPRFFGFLSYLTLGFQLFSLRSKDTKVGENPKGKKEIWESREMS